MTLYKFKTFRTSYYFPSFTKEREILYSLYTPYGGNVIVKLLWWAFKHVAPLRWLMKCGNPDAEFPYNKIMALCPKGSTMSYNMGTPGEEQKISMLGLTAEGERFFAKYSTKPKAQELSKNEIKVLTALQGDGITPKLYKSSILDDAVFFMTSCVSGKNPTSTKLNSSIIELLITLSQYHLSSSQNQNELKTCLSHGDFTPWNIIIENGKYQLIDWEMAEERPIGYDLFTYICHVAILLTPNISLKEVIDSHIESIESYYQLHNIVDWLPYLHDFAQKRVVYDESKGDFNKANKFKELISL